MKTAGRRLAMAAWLILCGAMAAYSQQYAYPYLNPNLTVEQRADNIVSLMTLDEKIAAIGNAAVPRLNIPAPGSSECIHQLVRRAGRGGRSEEHTSELQSLRHLVCRLLL